MRRYSYTPVIVACVCLLSLQLTGVHVHADENGYIGIPEAPFTHRHGHHDHHDANHAGVANADHADHGSAGDTRDFEGARDVYLLDLALSIFKMPLAMLALVLLFVLFPSVRTFVGFDFSYRLLSGRHTRWRPPLRAPPQPA